MAKKSKRDKNRKEQHQKLQQSTPEELIKQGKAFLEKGKARDAIDVLKQAEKKNAGADDVRPMLYRAYMMRYDQLLSKGMIPEADTVKKLAFGLMPSPDRMRESDVIEWVSRASVAEALKVAVDFSKKHSPSPGIDRHLAYRLMLTDDWQPLDQLAADHPLRPNSKAVREAVTLMNRGDWENALVLLKDIPRVSPYASIRLFCRAMVLFYEENDSELNRTLSRIPDDFPLAACIETLKQCAGNGDGTHGSASSSHPTCLREGPDDPEKTVSDIFNCMDKGHYKQAARHISDLSDGIFPLHPVFARQQILESLIFSSEFHNHDIDDITQMVAILLPNRETALLKSKLLLIFSSDPRRSVESYLSLLKKEIPDIQQRNMVSGMVLIATARMLKIEESEPHPLKRMFNRFITGGSDEADTDQVVLDMGMQSIDVDPSNRQAYEMLAGLPRYSRNAKRSIENALLKMSAVFPDDPFPCLELATLYYEKNAFRKAERVLDEAARRAPHDNRVLERRALSLVISAGKNLDRGKHHLALSDLEKAEGMAAKAILPMIAWKRSFYEMISDPGRLENIFRNAFPQMNPIDRVRCSGLLIQQMKSHGNPFQTSHIDAVKKILLQDIKRLSLSPADVVTLLSPFPGEFKPVLPKRPIAHILLTVCSDVFAVIPDGDLIPTFLLLFHHDILGFMAGELQQRLRRKHLSRKVDMLFFLVTLNYMTGFAYCSENYKDVLAMADDSERTRLAELSRKLSRHASGYLRSTLEHFDFQMMDLNVSGGDFPDPEYFDEDDADDEDALEEMISDILPLIEETKGALSKTERKNLIGKVEELVDEMDLRGLPEREIKDIRSHLRSISPTREILDIMFEIIDETDRGLLSREAQLLAFGKIIKQKQLRLL